MPSPDESEVAKRTLLSLFDVPQAKHYCQMFTPKQGSSSGSLKSYIDIHLHPGVVLKEGTHAFEEYRACALRDAERWLLFSASNYRRSLDLMTPGASSWAQVTLYYSSYFSACSLLGMFGGWIGLKEFVDVKTRYQGKQQLTMSKIKNVHTAYGPPHARFWDMFYGAIAPLSTWIDPSHRFALTPVSGLVTWLTDNRNNANYDSFFAYQLATNFQTSFNDRRFPESLPGMLRTQFDVAEGLLILAYKFAREFGLSTDALTSLSPQGSRKSKIEKLINRDRAPSLVQKTRWKTAVL